MSNIKSQIMFALVPCYSQSNDIFCSFCSSGNIYPMVVASHPSEPNQIALGMSDGSVHVMEPLESDTKWGPSAAQDNGSHPARTSSPAMTNPQSSEPPTR
jgi:hypothetical protein